jgi:pimeloyl-ACP methyl ester carboxylesterase
MSYVSVNGARLYYREIGSGPQTVVFSHSFLVSGDQFTYQLTHLADRYRCLAYDHRGHGRSEVTAGGYDMENLYADGLGFIEALGCAPCHFVGLSTGGFVGLRLGIRRPDLLRSLVLMDTSADPEPWQARLQFSALGQLVRLVGWRPLTGKVMTTLFGHRFLADPDRQNEVDSWRQRLQSVDIAAARKFAAGIFNREGVRDQLGRIRIPTLVMVGEEDRATPPFRARRIAAGIPGAQLETISGAGHLCTVEDPSAVNAALDRFLAGRE